MADSLREQIMQELVALATAATDAPVYRSRDAALNLEQLPAVVITPMTDEPGEDRGAVFWIDWTLQVAVDVVVGAGVDATANPILADIHHAFMDDRDLSGVPGVTEIRAGTVQFQMQNNGGELAFARAMFMVRYRTLDSDTTVPAL
jgi:hypothetical protein